MAVAWVIIGLTAWFGATFSPMLLFRLFRRSGRLRGSAMRLHLLFAPAVAGTWWLSAFLFTLANGDQARGPDERGLGILLLPSMVMVLVVVGIYYVGLAVAAWKDRKSIGANVR